MATLHEQFLNEWFQFIKDDPDNEWNYNLEVQDIKA